MEPVQACLLLARKAIKSLVAPRVEENLQHRPYLDGKVTIDQSRCSRGQMERTEALKRVLLMRIIHLQC